MGETGAPPKQQAQPPPAQAQPPPAQARPPPAQAQAPPAQSPKQTLMDPKAEAFVRMAQKRINEQIEYLRKNNNNHKAIEYFYQGFQNLHTARLEEIRKEKAAGKKIIGIYCNFVPVELIIAAGAVPLRMCTGFSDTILSAEEILPRNFCPLLKSSFGSIIEKSPLLNLVDVVVIPTSCDGKKKLSELLAEHLPVWIMEVPHATNTPEARRLWLNEIRSFKKQLQKFTGNRITRKKIKKAVAITNNQRAQVHKLYNLRKKAPPIWGKDALMVTNFAYYDDPERWTRQAEILNNELEKTPPIPAKGHRPRILLTGTPIVMPTWKMPILVEESGGMIVVDDICTGTKGFWDPVETSTWTGSDMMVSLADRYLMNTCATFTPNTARLIRLKRFVKDWKVDGVLYYVIMACHPYGMEQRKINQEMEKMNIPVLNIETDFSEEDVEQIRTRLEAFMEMIKTRHALLTGTVLDKELHPRGYAMEGLAPAMTQEQVAQRLATAPSAQAVASKEMQEMSFPFVEVKDSTNFKSSLATPVASILEGAASAKEKPRDQAPPTAAPPLAPQAQAPAATPAQAPPKEQPVAQTQAPAAASAHAPQGQTQAPQQQPATQAPTPQEEPVEKKDSGAGDDEAKETATLLNEVKQLVVGGDPEAAETKQAKATLKEAIDSYKEKDFTKAKELAQQAKGKLSTDDPFTL